MRILLVKGASLNREVPQFSYPLGLMYLAAYLRQRQPGHDQRIIDLRCERHPFESLAAVLEDFDPDMVAVSALTAEAASLHETARIAKARRMDTVVVVGGPHISACTDDVAGNTNIDVMVIGEGEETYCAIVSACAAGNGVPAGIRGTGLRAHGRVEWAPPRPPLEDLGELPFPAWDLVSVERYARLGRAGNLRRGRFLPVFTSRGCPYQCFYCHNLFGKSFRARPTENVVEEVRRIHEAYGITDIEIYDDIFNMDLARAKAICRGLIDLDLRLKLAFPNGVRVDRLDRELVALLAQAGTTNLAIAIETASPRLQKVIHKHLDLERAKEAISWLDEEGIVTNGYFMLGFPGETRDEIESTITYAVETDLHFASFFIVTPYPGTPLWEQTMRERGSSSLDFREYNYLSGYFNLSAVSGEELRRLQREAYRRFYARKLPKIIATLPRLRIDWRNAAWIWLRRMLDRGGLNRTQVIAP
ncbi:MAG: B12-binding domain-containing radical SAM protein [Candidatus Eisenbacteria bacterium]|nr:B12-binding domain-containing radical SAM protein [Candidatus Eisenbacteria bacterium]